MKSLLLAAVFGFFILATQTAESAAATAESSATTFVDEPTPTANQVVPDLQ